MQKVVQEKWVLFTKHALSSPMDIGVHASQDAPKLRALADEYGLQIAGAPEHAYWDMAVQGAPHWLEIWLPVHAKAGQPELAGLKRVEPYRCLSADFRRPIHEIGDAWRDLGEAASKLGLETTNHDREIYRTMDCDDPTRNEIELQLGVK